MMNFLKTYANSITDFVTNVIDDPSERSEKIVETPGDQSTSTDQKEQSRSTFLGWLPNLPYPTGESALVYYMNSLASFGSDSSSDQSKVTFDHDVEKTTIVEDIHEVTVPSGNADPEPPHTDSSDSDLAFANWVNGFSSRTGKVWHQVKQDLSEVVNAISMEHKDAVTRTASSVRQQLSSVAEAAKKIDMSQFSVLPESGGGEVRTDAPREIQRTGPPEYSDLPSFADLRTDVSNFFQGMFSSLFGHEEDKPASTKDKREACLHVLRADPATYETEPPLPPEHLGVLSYSDWRGAYFNEVTCQPLPGVPLSSARDPENEGRDVDELLQPPQPTPEELLEQNPFMRNYLSQLVRVEGQDDNKGISDADFWSRYYYRVWLLDVTEYRRRRLAERVESKLGSVAAPDSGSIGQSVQPTSQKGSSAIDTSDWFDASDNDAQSQPTSPRAKQYAETPQPSASIATLRTPNDLPSTTVLEAVTVDHDDKSNKRVGKQRKRKGKKRNEGDPGDEAQRNIAKGPVSDEDSPKAVSPLTIPKMEEHRKNSSVHSVIESDDPITSGSSSVVVLSNSEEDPDGIPHTPCSRGGHKPGSENEDSDDWGELSADDFETVPRSVTALPAPSVDRVDEEGDAWDNWS